MWGSKTASRLDELDYVVIDLETTGLFPTAHDRVVEIAALRYAPSGVVRDKWVTLVNPGRDMGATSVHGIGAGDVLAAPLFADVVGDVCQRLAGAVVVAHNARFDVSFLAAEFARTGYHLPTLPTLCTMQLPNQLGVPAGRSLRAACAAFGVAYDDAHAHGALHDAQAAAGLFGRLLEIAWRAGHHTLDTLGCAIPLPSAAQWPACRAASRTHTRTHATSIRQSKFGFLTGVAQRAAARPIDDAQSAPYLDLLDRVLEDQVVTDVELNGLIATAREWGLSSQQVIAAHERYFVSLVEAAWQDGVFSTGEQRELQQVGYWLGLTPDEVAGIASAHQPPSEAARAAATETATALVGKSVCFTGQLTCTRGGRPITRQQAQQLATAAGLEVRDGVTKDLDILVLADPHTQSGKAAKARANDARLIAEPVFWRTVGVTVD